MAGTRAKRSQSRGTGLVSEVASARRSTLLTRTSIALMESRALTPEA